MHLFKGHIAIKYKLELREPFPAPPHLRQLKSIVAHSGV